MKTVLMSTALRLLLLTSLLVGSQWVVQSPARADQEQSMMFEFHVGPYAPKTDEAFESATPYADAFGSELMWSWGGSWDYQVIRDYGSLAISAGLRYATITGGAAETDSDDSTSLNILPLSLGLTYRLDIFATRWNVPIVPYVKGGATMALWWINNGKGEIANTWSLEEPYEERTAWSHTLGYYYGGGVQFLLDVFSNRMSTTMNNEMGITNTYVFVEYLEQELNDFGSGSSIELSGQGFSFGLMFEF